MSNAEKFRNMNTDKFGFDGFAGNRFVLFIA